MEVMRAGGAMVPLNDDGTLVEAVRQGHHLRTGRRTRRAPGKTRGWWISQGDNASSRRRRWLSVGVLHGVDDGVAAGGDPSEVLPLEEEEREVRRRSNQAKNRGEWCSP
jgi:hypothetical protein